MYKECLEEHVKIDWGIGESVGNHDPPDAMATEDCYACVKKTTHCKVHDVVPVVLPSLPASSPALLSAVIPASPPFSSAPTRRGTRKRSSLPRLSRLQLLEAIKAGGVNAVLCRLRPSGGRNNPAVLWEDEGGC